MVITKKKVEQSEEEAKIVAELKQAFEGDDTVVALNASSSEVVKNAAKAAQYSYVYAWAYGGPYFVCKDEGQREDVKRKVKTASEQIVKGKTPEENEITAILRKINPAPYKIIASPSL